MTFEDGDEYGEDEIVHYENTYITSPEEYGPDQKFKTAEVKSVIEDVLHDRLDGQEYDPRIASTTSKEICSMVLERVKQLGYKRYKLVVEVTFSEKKGQAVRVGSHCLWNPKTDNFSSAFFETAGMFCCCTVFGLYYE